MPADADNIEQLVSAFEEYWPLQWRESVLWPQEPFSYHAGWEGFLAVRLSDMNPAREMPELVRQLRQDPACRVFMIMVG
ncbi:MAG: hypothetical protein ACUVTU_06475 [Desulfurispora sp.]|uniref:hypothetical protein n=1 Tax=Desulfurispora sp. TaxID=3014275 RepID=UPI00404B14E9